jgi:hypothetical protein
MKGVFIPLYVSLITWKWKSNYFCSILEVFHKVLWKIKNRVICPLNTNQSIHKLGIDGRIWNIINDFHVNTQSALLVNQCQSKYFTVDDGILSSPICQLYMRFFSRGLSENCNMYDCFCIKAETPFSCIMSNSTKPCVLVKLYKSVVLPTVTAVKCGTI